MKITTADDGVIDVSVRQSWLNNHDMCPSRARRELLEYPDGTPPSTATAIGTAMHAGIEGTLLGVDVPEALTAVRSAYAAEAAVEGFGQDMTHDKALAVAYKCFSAWHTKIYPRLEDVDDVEHDFKVQVAERPGVRLWISGTYDAKIGGDIWDWKTGANLRKYIDAFGGEGWMLKRWANQPTFYTLADAIETGDWSPRQFHYGAVSKQDYSVSVLTVDRGPADWLWLVDKMWSVYDSFGAPASLNDQGWWCSVKWCPFWGSCKGKPRALPS